MKLHDCIDDDFKAWIEKQHVFFVATAPLSGNGHVNLSPKGYDALRIIDDKTICYRDLAGSGNETSAHIAENGRLTFMFCAFEGAPRILRLYGKGEILLPDHPKFNTYLSKHYQNDMKPGTRQIVVNHVDRVQTSCGYAVPFMDFKEDRTTLCNFFEKKGGEGSVDYMREKTPRTSIDDIPTPQGTKFNKEEGVVNKGGSPAIWKMVAALVLLLSVAIPVAYGAAGSI
ncbi:Pyridoxamine 5'-phosphate oxidase-related FMN-binding [Seminavis robusta]|uniref:Pyridoxamine 5'-phosphate oxidase-related FMN-binding n=1 Tax=Seminavis robusta TaxID=568900 RepID=A0A9N8DT37_9STRA|nr:Pyridoxamine 5'-phosphate oxidase-related FMN-binding [Seminavis robusta]|eukprot:Sro351_g124030.1 Pyridoxamine 5'-phosphate oxidase-related FMN-binding (228) ;mRNA; r:61177-61959